MRTPEQERAAYAYLTTTDVAEKLSVSRSQVVALIRAGKMAAIDVGVGTRPEYRVAPDALDAFLASRKVA